MTLNIFKTSKGFPRVRGLSVSEQPTPRRGALYLGAPCPPRLQLSRYNHNLREIPLPDFDGDHRKSPHIALDYVPRPRKPYRLPRNERMREAFLCHGIAPESAIQQKLAEPFTPTIRQYPSSRDTLASEANSRKWARTAVGWDIARRRNASGTQRMLSMIERLKRMTPKPGGQPIWSAIRIVCSHRTLFNIPRRVSKFLESETGLLAELRVEEDFHNPHAVILRGNRSNIMRAADEIATEFRSVEIQELGEATAAEYEARRIWPIVEDVRETDSSRSPDTFEAILAEKQLTVRWIEEPYESIKPPPVWTVESFNTYVTTLICSRIRPHLAVPFYGTSGKDGKMIDTEGIRMLRIACAFREKTARPYLTPDIVKFSMAFMARKGSHWAVRIFSKAERWGFPTDTSMFNILLDGLAQKRDVGRFYNWLVKMEEHFHHANAGTWLHLVKLVGKDEHRHSIIASMKELDLLKDPSARRDLAGIMADHDAYTAFSTGTALPTFLQAQETKYGADWYSLPALQGILRQFLRFAGYEERSEQSRALLIRDCESLIERPTMDGRKVDTYAFNIVLEYCARARDWDLALWALSSMEQHGCERDDGTFLSLLHLSLSTRSPTLLSIVLFHAIIYRRLRTRGRNLLQQVLGCTLADRIWKSVRPKILSGEMAKLLKGSPIGEADYVAGVEWAILSCVDGYVPVHPLLTAIRDVMRSDPPLHEQRRNGKRPVARKLAVAMRPATDRSQEPKTIILESAFDLDTMVHESTRPRDTRGTSTDDMTDLSAEKSAVALTNNHARELAEKLAVDVANDLAGKTTRKTAVDLTNQLAHETRKEIAGKSVEKSAVDIAHGTDQNSKADDPATYCLEGSAEPTAHDTALSTQPGPALVKKTRGSRRKQRRRGVEPAYEPSAKWQHAPLPLHRKLRKWLVAPDELVTPWVEHLEYERDRLWDPLDIGYRGYNRRVGIDRVQGSTEAFRERMTFEDAVPLVENTIEDSSDE